MTTVSLPPELRQPLPRRVRLSGQTWVIVVVVPILVAFMACVFIYSQHQLDQLDSFKSTGVSTTGVVTGWRIETTGSGRHRRDDCYIDYQYAPAGSVVVLGRAPHGRIHALAWLPLCAHLSRGQPIGVIYAPDNPSVSMLKDERTPDTAYDAPGDTGWRIKKAAILFTGIIGVVSLFMIYSLVKARNLVRLGTVTGPTFSDIVESYGRYGPVISFAYEFTDSAGKKITGKRTSVPKEFAKLQNCPVVLFDPTNSGDNVLYPSPYVVCVQPSFIR